MGLPQELGALPEANCIRAIGNRGYSIAELSLDFLGGQ
jgi:hypothetical protein